jgi:hypothetical protein
MRGCAAGHGCLAALLSFLGCGWWAAGFVRAGSTMHWFILIILGPMAQTQWNRCAVAHFIKIWLMAAATHTHLCAE